MPGNEPRASARELLGRVLERGREELARSSPALALSGLASGLGMGLSGLGVALVTAALGPGSGHELIGGLLYPIGFIVVIIGRQQLFTENTLYPVALLMDEPRRRHLGNLVRLWLTVFAANVLGALVFALLVARLQAAPAPVVDSLVHAGRQAVDHGWVHVFLSGIVGGWLIALAAWLVIAAADSIGQIALIFLVTLVVGDGHFAHCIATSGEILSAVVSGPVSGGQYLSWLAAATLGNVLGGVCIVSLLNYGQVVAGGDRGGGAGGAGSEQA